MPRVLVKSASTLILALAVLVQSSALALAEEASSAPWVASHKADYAPGETVVLNGGSWGSGEQVHIRVNDDDSQTWQHDADVVADDSGAFRHEFSLPDMFVASYSVTATGPHSGTATTTFTDSISFGSATANSNGSGTTTLVLNNPTSTASGDLLLAQISYDGGSGVPASGVTAPTGWTLHSTANSGTSLGQRIYYKVAGATEPASYTWTFASARKAAGGISAYSGVWGADPINVSGSSTGTSDVPLAPSVTTTVSRSTMVVRLFGTRANTALSVPANTARRFELANGNTGGVGAIGPSILSSDAEQVEVGATGTAASSGLSAAWVAHTVVLDWRSSSATAGNNVTSLNVARPQEVTAGDFMLANIVWRGAISVSAVPSGWTLIDARRNTGSNLNQAVYRKFAGSSEPTSYTWTLSGTGDAVGGISAYTDVDTSEPVDDSATNPSADSSVAAATSFAAPSVTTTSTDDYVVALFALDSNGTITAPAGMLQRYSQNVSNTGRAYGADVIQAAPGATGAKTATVASAARWVSQTVALTRASAGPSVLAFVTDAITGAVHGCLGPITIQTQNASGIERSVTSDKTVSLTTDGTGGFFSDDACGSSITSVTIEAATTSASFYYKPTARGTGSHLISVSADGLAGDAQTQTVNKAAQTLSFTEGSVPASAAYRSTFTPAATSTSGLAPTITVTGACSISSGVVTMTSGSGTCTVKANQAGDLDYEAAPEITSDVAAAAKTVTGSFVAANKIYDGSATATITLPTLSGVETGDDVSLTGGSATFDNANAGIGKTVTGTGFGLSGTDASHYALASTTLYSSADIDKATLSVNAQPGSKVYGEADPTLTATLSGFVNEETASSAGVLGAADCTRASGETVTGGPYTITCGPGTLNAANYDFVTGSTADFTIGARGVTVDFTAADRPYDGGTAATITGCSLAGVLEADSEDAECDASLATASFADANAGIDKVVTGSGFALSGDDAANYAIEQTNTTLATIHKADATISVVGYTGTYDAVAHGASGSATGVAGETLSGLDLGASFTNVPGGTATWTFTDTTGNYNDATGTVEILIGKADATISVLGYTGTYDASAHGASGSATGVVGETLSGLDLGASFTNVPGGTAGWTFTDVTGNYNDAAGTVAIVIEKAGSSVAVTCPTAAQTYTGSAQQPCSAVASGIGLTDVPLSVSYTDNVSVGTATASAAWAGDDNHWGSNDSATFAIDPLTVTASFTASNKVYDGTTAATIASRSLSGIVATDAGYVSLDGGTATFASPEIGTWTVTGTGFFLSGARAANYSLASTTLETTAQIVPPVRIDGLYAPVDMTNVGGTRIYNTVKGGSTVPVKFRLFNPDGSQVTTTTGLSVYATTVSCAAGTVEADVLAGAQGGTSLRYDTTEQLFIFNWAVPKGAGSCYRIRVQTSDGVSTFTTAAGTVQEAYFRSK